MLLLAYSGHEPEGGRGGDSGGEVKDWDVS